MSIPHLETPYHALVQQSTGSESRQTPREGALLVMEMILKAVWSEPSYVKMLLDEWRRSYERVYRSEGKEKAEQYLFECAVLIELDAPN